MKYIMRPAAGVERRHKKCGYESKYAIRTVVESKYVIKLWQGIKMRHQTCG